MQYRPDVQTAEQELVITFNWYILVSILVTVLFYESLVEEIGVKQTKVECEY